jgi:hypothetical protein
LGTTDQSASTKYLAWGTIRPISQCLRQNPTARCGYLIAGATIACGTGGKSSTRSVTTVCGLSPAKIAIELILRRSRGQHYVFADLGREFHNSFRRFLPHQPGTRGGGWRCFGSPHSDTRVVMPNARYFIVRDRDVWLIKYDGEEYGPYKSQNEALIFAIDAAQKLGAYGEIAEVCLMGENGHFRPEWVSRRNSDQPRP